MDPVVLVTIAIKFLLPVLIIPFPFFASLANFIWDTIDGDILMHFGLTNPVYQRLDKAADYLTYIFMFLAGRKWNIRNTIIALFVFRTVGQVLFFATNNDFFFFLFPNFLEPLFIIYSFLMLKYKEDAYIKYKKHFIPIWVVIVLFKYWNEYNIHIARIDLSSEFFGFNN